MKVYIVREADSPRDFMTMSEDAVQAAVQAIMHGPFGLEYEGDLIVWDWDANRTMVSRRERLARIMPPPLADGSVADTP